jgi:excisionase family DNA binding protein
MDQILYKVSSAMKRLDVCRATIYRLVQRGELEVVKVGSATRITAASINRLASGKPRE